METGGANLAAEMLQLGFTNVRIVQEGGHALEKYFEYLAEGDRIINPMTGKVIFLKPRPQN